MQESDSEVTQIIEEEAEEVEGSEEVVVRKAKRLLGLGTIFISLDESKIVDISKLYDLAKLRVLEELGRKRILVHELSDDEIEDMLRQKIQELHQEYLLQTEERRQSVKKDLQLSVTPQKDEVLVAKQEALVLELEECQSKARCFCEANDELKRENKRLKATNLTLEEEISEIRQEADKMKKELVKELSELRGLKKQLAQKIENQETLVSSNNTQLKVKKEKSERIGREEAHRFSSTTGCRDLQKVLEETSRKKRTRKTLATQMLILEEESSRLTTPDLVQIKTSLESFKAERKNFSS